MSNKYSPAARRVSFIIDKVFYAGLEKMATDEKTTASDLIRRALEKEYPDLPTSEPVVTIRRPGQPSVNLPPEVWKDLEQLLRRSRPGKRKPPKK